MVDRIRAGDGFAETELVTRFDRGVRAILRNVARNSALVEDLHQETMRILLERIREGAIRDPTQLGSFVASLARNLATQHFRKAQQTQSTGEGELERLVDPSPDAQEALAQRDQANLVRQVLESLSMKRDRDVLRRFYLGQDDKDLLCAEYGLSSLQFNRVLHRARDRFRELWQQMAASAHP